MDRMDKNQCHEREGKNLNSVCATDIDIVCVGSRISSSHVESAEQQSSGKPSRSGRCHPDADRLSKTRVSSSKTPYMQSSPLAVPYPTRTPNFQIVPLRGCPASSTGMDYSWDRSTTPRLVHRCVAKIRSKIQIW